jgi:hypothetical protein
MIANSVEVTPAPLVLTASTVDLDADSQNSQGQAIIPAGTLVGTFTQSGIFDPVGDYESTASFTRFAGSTSETPLEVTLSDDGGTNLVTTSADTVISPYLAIGSSPFTLQVADTGSGALSNVGGSVEVTDVAPTGSNTQPTLNALMGSTFSGTVAAFTLDFGGSQNLSSLYSASINWGDGGPNTSGTIEAGVTPGTYLVEGSHTYADIGTKIDNQAAGTEPISVTMTRLGTGGLSDTVDNTFTIADAPIVATALTTYENTATADVQGDAIVPSGVVVGTFTQAGGPRLTTAYSGSTVTFTGSSEPTPLSFTFDSSSGIFTARTASPTVISPYLTPGANPFTLQIVDGIGGSTDTSTSSLDVSDVHAVATQTQPIVQVVEGNVFSGPVASFTLPYGSGLDLSGQFTATINWGDGTPPTSGTVEQGSAPSTYVVIGDHIYAGIGSKIPNEAAGANSIVTNVTRTLTAGTSESFSNTSTVTDAPISLTATTAYLTAGSVDAQGNSIVPAGTVVASFQQIGGVRLTSAYSGSTVAFPGSSSPTPLTITSMQDGTAFLAVTASPTTISPDLIPGPSTFQVSVIDNVGGGTATDSASLDIADVPPTATPQQPPITTTQGRVFHGPVAFYSLAFGNGQNLSDLYAATINWGDGTPATTGTIETGPTSNTYEVVGSHTYSEIGTRVPGQAEGTNPVSVTISRLGPYGSSKTISAQATVADAPITTNAGTVYLEASTSNSQGQAVIPSGEIVGTFTQVGASRSPSAFTGSTVTFPGSSNPTPLVFSLNSSNGVYTAATAEPTLISPDFQPGDSPFTFEVVDGVGGSTSESSGSLNVADVPPIVNVTQPIVNANLNVPFSGAVAGFSTAYGVGQNLSGLFAATIHWGDGTPPTSGTVEAGATPGSYLVLGSHTYTGVGTPVAGSTAGTYPISVTVTRTGTAGSFNTATNVATVQDAPDQVSGALSPASDSGVSNLDGITKDVQPVFSGTSEPGSTISLYAVPAGTHIFVPIGTTTTDASGSWSLATIPLSDGDYTINALSVDHFGLASAVTQVMPNAHQGPLVIQTKSPQVENVQFIQKISQVAVTFDDVEGGLDLSSLMNTAAYQLSEPGVKASDLILTGPVLQSYSPTLQTATVLLTLNGGHKFPKNTVNLTIEGSSISDDAGNRLDGSFQGSLPSGNGQPGSNFTATVSTTSPPTPTPKGPQTSTIKTKSVATNGGSTKLIQTQAVRPRQVVVVPKLGK